MRRDGTLPVPPIAPIEVQGYVYDAKFRMASLLRSFGDTARADKLKQEACHCQALDAYWMSRAAFYAIALDGEKKPVEIISSRIPDIFFFHVPLTKERARAVVKRLMQPDMFSGWGWRTLCEKRTHFQSAQLSSQDQLAA